VPGQGTSVRIYLPASATEAPKEAPSPQVRETSVKGRESILFVEDEELILKMMETMLKSQGYRVYTAQDGLQAIEVFQRHVQDIDLVVSDIGLPGLSGKEVFERLKEMHSRVRVLLATGFIQPEERMELLEQGVLHLLDKPYTPTTLLTTIRCILDAPL